MSRVVALALFIVAGAFSQQPRDEPRFEVASIKPPDPNPDSPVFIGMSADGAMVKYTNITLLECIRGAYRVRDFQIVGPDWMTKARFEISAKLPPRSSADEIPEMLKALLAERFKLEIRRETKTENVYALEAGNGGANRRPAESKKETNSPQAMGPDGQPRPMMMFAFALGRGVTITAPSASIESLVWLISRFTVRPMVDVTGIKGQYNFWLTFAAETNIPPVLDGAAPSAEPVPSVFDAVKQYGL